MTEIPSLLALEAGHLEPKRPSCPLRFQGRGFCPDSGGCWQSLAFLGILLSFCSRAVIPWPLPCVPSLALLETLVMGFRAHCNPVGPQLNQLRLGRLFPNEV